MDTQRRDSRVIRVFLVDDHEIIRNGLKRIFKDLPDIEVVGEAEDTNGLIEKLQKARPDIVVIDLSMPSSTGPSLVKEIRALECSPQVVIFTMFHEDVYAVTYLTAGAGAFISKTKPTKELVEAIRTVYRKGKYITPEVAEWLLMRQSDLERAERKVTLTPAELEVVRALAQGKRAVDIARETGRSVSTVNTYVYRIKTKLGLKTIVQIVQYAKESGLLG